MSQFDRERQIARQEAGLCIMAGCGAESVTENHCETHRRAFNVMMRERYLRRSGGALAKPHRRHTCGGCGNEGHNARTCTYRPTAPGA